MKMTGCGEKNRSFIATCASGMESLLSDELVSFGSRIIEKAPGAITFQGSLETAYRSCLWSRFASKVLFPLKEFPVSDTDSLYGEIAKIDWSEYFSLKESFAVECTSAKSLLRHTGFSALRVKDAVADQFRDRFGARPSVAVSRPDIRIHLYLKEGSATVSLDLSGDTLHKRGYRKEGGEAPLKETLAAAIMTLAGWNDSVTPETTLLDPMCGSGTLLIEAALIYRDIAPGLGRDYYGFMGWKGHDMALWKRLVKEANNRKRLGMNRPCPRIIGYDADREAINIALDNIRQAGLSGTVHVERKEIARLLNPQSKPGDGINRPGMIVVNPPYGERLGTKNIARYVYRCLGRKIRENFADWRTGFFTANADLTDELYMKPLKRFRLYNGPLACHLYLYDNTSNKDKVPKPSSFNLNLTDKGAGDFANRLRKNFKHLKKWAKRESATCFRVYDGDIPEYNVAVDLYGKWIHVQEYAPPKTIDPQKSSDRLRRILRDIRDIFGVRSNMVFLKVRTRQKGRSQYGKMNNRGKLREVSENGCRILVNLTDYLDTGLFLDHRTTRRMIQEMAQGKRFLNLFGYTGSATVNAAVGGARSSVTVDASRAYLEWGRCNLALNGFSEANHKMINAECISWLAKTRDQFDLIYVDPPTFSNSKGRKGLFDIQQDHVKLIRSAMDRLAPEGILIFSTNFSRFRMDHDGLSGLHIDDITGLTIPPDFERRPRIHQCWKIQHMI